MQMVREAHKEELAEQERQISLLTQANRALVKQVEEEEKLPRHPVFRPSTSPGP